MNDFLEFLANRKYSYYHYFWVVNPQAFTRMDCYERIIKDARYEEVVNIINHLPVEQQTIVNERFNELISL
jgi:hypothetical protein